MSTLTLVRCCQLSKAPSGFFSQPVRRKCGRSEFVIFKLAVLLFATLFTTNSYSATPDNKLALQPHPSLSPRSVVEFQLIALQQASDNGIEATFRFASPANKKMTGPLAKFSRLFDSAQYQPMLENRGTQIKLVSNDGYNAELLAGVVDETGDLHWYRFQLSKQTEAPYVGCWMTDAVMAVAHPGRSA